MAKFIENIEILGMILLFAFALFGLGYILFYGFATVNPNPFLFQ